MDTPTEPAGAHVVLYRHLPTSKTTVFAILLCKRTLNAPIHPGLWSLFGGTCEPNESDVRTVTREVDEELEICLEPGQLARLCSVPVWRREGVSQVSYFNAPLERDMAQLWLRFQTESCMVEGEALGWFAADEVHYLPVRPEDRAALSNFFSRYGT